MSQGSKLFELICDVHRFILFNRGVVENAPLQVYHSALIFSPSRSLTRVTFKNEEPKWVTAKSAIDSTWGACLQTLEGHSYSINSVVFSPDGTRIASGSDDGTVRIWDAGNGTCLQILKNFESSTLFDPGTPGNTAWTGTSNIQRICETPQHPTYGLNSYRTWITRNGQNVIWLPPEYRPSTFALTSSTMVIGCRSGRVLIFGFSMT